MSAINYVERLKAFKENSDNAILTVLIDYQKLFPEMEQEPKPFTVDVLCAYLHQIRHADKNDQELLMTSSLTFYAALPMNIAQEIFPAESQAGYISSSNSRIGQLANIENYYNFIKFHDFPEAQLEDAFFETHLKKLEAMLIPSNLDLFDSSLPMGRNVIKLKKEAELNLFFKFISSLLCSAFLTMHWKEPLLRLGVKHTQVLINA